MSDAAREARAARVARLRGRVQELLQMVPGLRRFLSELGRIELIDRSLALGAQALLALIPLLIMLGALLPSWLGRELVGQVSDAIGVEPDTLSPLRRAVNGTDEIQPQTGGLSLLVAIASATSFSRAMQRMYARAWDLPTYRGLRAIRGSVLWLLGWVATMQVLALLLGAVGALPLDSLVKFATQLSANTLLWWWTAHLLLGGRVAWRLLLPGAIFSGLLVVVLSHVSSLFMPAFTQANVAQYGALGAVFAVASWLVLFGGALVVATLLGRLVATSLLHEAPPGVSEP